MTTPQFLTVKQTAEYVGCSEAQVWRMLRDGTIPARYVIALSKSGTHKRINRAAFGPVEPTQLHQPMTEDRFRQIVREEIRGLFRIDGAA